jgi:hypothetical protein
MQISSHQVNISMLASVHHAVAYAIKGTINLKPFHRGQWLGFNPIAIEGLTWD